MRVHEMFWLKWFFSILIWFRISLAQHEIWQPDITLYNSISHNVDYFGATNFLVQESGVVIWVPPATLKTLCDSNLRYWPFDTHKCSLLFGSWVHHGHEIDILPKKVNPHFELFIENPEWIITDFATKRNVMKYDCCLEPYINVQYNITISRRSTIYSTVILAPSFVIMLMILLTFWLPAQYGEKVLLNAITALIIVLFLLYFSQKLNVMASHTPLVGKILSYVWSNTLHLFILQLFRQFYSTAMHCIWCVFPR